MFITRTQPQNQHLQTSHKVLSLGFLSVANSTEGCLLARYIILLKENNDLKIEEKA